MKKYKLFSFPMSFFVFFILVAIISIKILPVVSSVADANTNYAVELQMYNGNIKNNSNTISPRLKLTNSGDSDINLSDVNILYYYTVDGETDQNFWCDWSSKGSSEVTGTFLKLASSIDSADYCLTIGFTDDAGSLASGESVELHLRIAKSDWSNYTQSNDHSFNGSSSNYSDWDKIPVYLNNDLVWGRDIETIPVPQTPPPTETPAPEPDDSPEPTPPPEASVPELTVQMYNNHIKSESNTLSPKFKLYNTGDSTIDLEKIKLRYYYTINGEKNQDFWCDWSSAGTNNIIGTLVKMPVAMIGADYYLELGFKEGTSELEAGQSLEIQTRIAKSDWTNYSQTDDFSFNPIDKKYIEWDKVSVYYDGNLIIGAEPDEVAPIPVPNRSVELKMCNSNIKDKSNTIYARYILNNTGNIPVNLKDVKIRYYYTIDGEKAQNFWCDWSQIGSNHVTGKFVKINEPLDSMDYYVEVGFNEKAGILEPGVNIEIHTRIAKSDWTNYLQSNDYSFCGSKNDYIVWNKAALIIDGDMAWGEGSFLERTSITDVSASETSLIITWLPVYGATGYEIESNGQVIGTVSETAFDHTGLTPGTLYQYKVRAISSTLRGRWSDPIEKWTLPDVPSGISLEATESDIVLAWEERAGEIGYDIEIDKMILEDAKSPYFHTNLLPGSVHTYRIRAKNASGRGQWTEPLVKWTIPGKVENINLFATQNEIYLSWYYTEGADSYEVEAEGLIITTDGLEAIATDLLPGVEYKFRVRANNGSGKGGWSDEYAKWTLPDIVEDVSTHSTETDITVSWTEVSGATDYDIEVDEQIVENQTSPYIHPNLGFGSIHTYRVRAKNSSGSGFWSEVVQAWTLPGTVDGLEAHPFQNEIILQWYPVNGATEYDIEVDGDITTGISMPYIHTGFNAGELYKYRVRARNSSGFGVWSEEISIWTLPDNVFTVRSNATQATIGLEWNEIIGATGYDIEIDGILIEDITSSYLHEDLYEGSKHIYRLRAKNSSGIGLWSEKITRWTLPGIPENVSLFAGGTYLGASWDEVIGATIYDIAINGALIENVTFPFTATGLENGKEYTVKIRAKNDSGFGLWSDEISLWTVPGVVEDISASSSQTWIEFKWNDITGATSYDIEINGELFRDVASPYNFSNLEMGTKHILRIRAKNSSGEGDWSETFIKWTLPGIPENLAVQAGNNLISLTWDEVPGAAGYDIEIYGTPVDTAGQTTYSHHGLNANTQHTYRVRAKNDSGVGEWTAYVAKTTLAGIPEHIYEESYDTQIQISWEAVAGIKYYDIEADGEVITGLVDTVYTHTGLVPDTLHTYRIRSGNDDGTSEWSGTYPI